MTSPSLYLRHHTENIPSENDVSIPKTHIYLCRIKFIMHHATTKKTINVFFTLRHPCPSETLFFTFSARLLMIWCNECLHSLYMSFPNFFCLAALCKALRLRLQKWKMGGGMLICWYLSGRIWRLVTCLAVHVTCSVHMQPVYGNTVASSWLFYIVPPFIPDTLNQNRSRFMVLQFIRLTKYFLRCFLV